MTKMSKVIAALGVVAGLGVATLPLSSYAVFPPEGAYSQSTTAKVEAIVEGAIAIASQVGGSAGDTVNLGNVMPGAITAESSVLDIIVTSNSAGAKFDLYVRAMNDGNMIGKTTGDKIAPGTPKGGDSKWGFKYTTNGTDWSTDYAGVPTTDTKLNTTSNLVTTKNETTNKGEQKSSFKFQASTAPTLTADTYTGSVVFTAVVE